MSTRCIRCGKGYCSWFQHCIAIHWGNAYLATSVFISLHRGYWCDRYACGRRLGFWSKSGHLVSISTRHATSVFSQHSLQSELNKCIQLMHDSRLLPRPQELRSRYCRFIKSSPLSNVQKWMPFEHVSFYSYTFSAHLSCLSWFGV